MKVLEQFQNISTNYSINNSIMRYIFLNFMMTIGKGFDILKNKYTQKIKILSIHLVALKGISSQRTYVLDFVKAHINFF